MSAPDMLFISTVIKTGKNQINLNVQGSKSIPLHFLYTIISSNSQNIITNSEERKLKYEIIWEGPFGLPGFENVSNLHQLPNACGLKKMKSFINPSIQKEIS